MAWGTGGKEEGQGHRWTRTWVDQDRNTHKQGHRWTKQGHKWTRTEALTDMERDMEWTWTIFTDNIKKMS